MLECTQLQHHLLCHSDFVSGSSVSYSTTTLRLYRCSQSLSLPCLCCFHSVAPQVNISAPPFLIQGEILTVNCSVTSFPSSAISMFFRGTRILLASGIASYSTAGLWYRFTYSTTAMYPSDEGNYTCSATITHGQPAVTEVYSETVFVPVYGGSCSHAL